MKTSIRTHEGRVALITGAAQGIGQAIAVALAERGAQVIVTDLAIPNDTVKKIGSAAHGLQLDVTKEEDWCSVLEKSQKIAEVDIVINNAGFFPNWPIDELDLQTWRKTMATNMAKNNGYKFGLSFFKCEAILASNEKEKMGAFYRNFI